MFYSSKIELTLSASTWVKEIPHKMKIEPSTSNITHAHSPRKETKFSMLIQPELVLSFDVDSDDIKSLFLDLIT